MLDARRFAVDCVTFSTDTIMINSGVWTLKPPTWAHSSWPGQLFMSVHWTNGKMQRREPELWRKGKGREATHTTLQLMFTYELQCEIFSSKQMSMDAGCRTVLLMSYVKRL